MATWRVYVEAWTLIPVDVEADTEAEARDAWADQWENPTGDLEQADFDFKVNEVLDPVERQSEIDAAQDWEDHWQTVADAEADAVEEDQGA
jgi:hypothetical protein